MKRALLTLGVCLIAAPVLADSQAGSVMINPAVGYSDPDSDRNLNDGVTYQLSGEYRATENWAGQLYYSESGTENTGVPGQSDDSQDYLKYGVNAVYYFNADSALQPYLKAGIGAGEYEDDNDTQLNLGIGARYFFTCAMSANAELSNAHSTDDDYDDGMVLVGLAYSFGGNTCKKSEPAPAPVVAAAPADSDGDGVIDANDKCPGTPAGTPVNASGCELDSDGDGVVDSKDACPGTSAGTKVDAKGCVPQKAVMESFTLNITFPTNSDVITAQYQPEVKKVADFMNKHADVTVVIEGHTDSQGAEAYNQKLSQRRADSVRNSLVSKYGIAADRIKAVGYGEAKPIASNDTADGRAKNRRVVAVMEKEVLQ